VARPSSPPAPRIACVEVNEDGTTGGSHRALELLAHGLGSAGFELVPVFYQDNRVAERLAAAGFDVRILGALRAHERQVNATGGLPERLVKAYRAVRDRADFLKHERIALVHLNNSPFVGYDDWLPASRMLGLPCVATAMTRVAPTGRWPLRLLARHFDAYLPCSEYMARSLQEAGMPPGRTEVVHLGIDVEGFAQSATKTRASMRAALQVVADEFVVLMVGNLREWKGQHVVLDAVARLPGALQSRVRVLLAGEASAQDQSYVQRLRDQCEHLHRPANVQLLGSRPDVADLLTAADVMVHASIAPEPFGLVIVEAMAMGVPVVASDTGGPAEIIDAGSGLLVPAGDAAPLASALQRLAADPKLCRALGTGGQRRAAVFSADRVAQAHAAIYRRLLVGRGAAPAT
jgi:glycosyltransferase involved in cell wall biosynthesis